MPGEESMRRARSIRHRIGSIPESYRIGPRDKVSYAYSRLSFRTFELGFGLIGSCVSRGASKANSLDGSGQIPRCS